MFPSSLDICTREYLTVHSSHECNVNTPLDLHEPLFKMKAINLKFPIEDLDSPGFPSTLSTITPILSLSELDHWYLIVYFIRSEDNPSDDCTRASQPKDFGANCRWITHLLYLFSIGS